MTNAGAVRRDLHPRLRFPRAGGNEDPRALELDHAHPAGVHRSQGLEVAEGRGVEALVAARVEERRPFGHADARSVEGDVDPAFAHGASRLRSPFSRAETMAFAAVCPSPQMEASRITWASSSRRTFSRAPSPFRARRESASSCRTVPTRQGTH